MLDNQKIDIVTYTDHISHYIEGTLVLHNNDDLPAIDGGHDNWSFWYKNGWLHRDNDLPAAILPKSGIQEWYRNNVRHRTTGPAIIGNGQPAEWYVNGEVCNTKKQFQEAAELTDEGMSFILLKYEFVEKE